MASNVFSRFLPADTGSPSIYETLRQQDESEISDLEERAAMAIDEEHLGEGFPDYELDASDLDDAGKPSTATRKVTRKDKTSQRPLVQTASQMPEPEEADDDVPQSLLIEDNDSPVSPLREQQPRPMHSPVPGGTSRAARTKWRATQEQQRLYTDTPPTRNQQPHTARHLPGLTIASARERAMWRWANVEDLDNFLRDVYDYFLGNGIWCILLSRLLNLL